MTDWENVRYRLALTEDDKLEGVIERLLPVLLPALTDQDTPARASALEVVKHVNQRLRNVTTLKLPVRLLASMVMPRAEPDAADDDDADDADDDDEDGGAGGAAARAAPAAPVASSTSLAPASSPTATATPTPPALSSFGRSMALMYLRMGLGREPPETQEELLHVLWRGVAQLPQGQMRAGVLDLIVRALPHAVIPKDVSLRRDAFSSLLSNAADRGVVLSHLRDTLLYSLPRRDAKADAVPAGLSAAVLKELQPAQASERLSPKQLLDRKLAALSFLGATLFDDSEVLPAALIAAADGHHEVAKRGEELVRRLPDADPEDAALVSALFTLVMGDAASGRSPAAQGVRIRALAVLSRSVRAANDFRRALQVCFACLFGEGTTVRLQQAGVDWAVHVFRACKPAVLRPIAPVFLGGLVKLVAALARQAADPAGAAAAAAAAAAEAAAADDAAPGAAGAGGRASKATRVSVHAPVLALRLRESAYGALGSLAAAAPEACAKDLTLPTLLFGRLQDEQSDAKLAVAEALSRIAPAFAAAPRERRGGIELLLEHARNGEPRARQAALDWACTVFPFDDVRARFLCVLLAGDARVELRDAAVRGLHPATFRPKRSGDDGGAGRRKADAAAAKMDAAVATGGAGGGSSGGAGGAVAGDVDMEGAVAGGDGSAAGDARIDVDGDSVAMSGDPERDYPTLAAVVEWATHDATSSGAKRERGQEEPAGGLVLGKSLTSLRPHSLAALLVFAARCMRADAMRLREGPAVTPEVVARLRSIVEYSLTAPPADAGSGHLHYVAACVLLRLITLSARSSGGEGDGGLAAEYATRLPWLQKWLHAPQVHVREVMARVLGAVATSLPVDGAASLVADLTKSVSASRSEAHGALAALGYVLRALPSAPVAEARAGAAGADSATSTGDADMEGADEDALLEHALRLSMADGGGAAGAGAGAASASAGGGGTAVPAELLQTATTAIVTQVFASGGGGVAGVAACASLALIARRGAVPLPLGAPSVAAAAAESDAAAVEAAGAVTPADVLASGVPSTRFELVASLRALARAAGSQRVRTSADKAREREDARRKAKGDKGGAGASGDGGPTKRAAVNGRLAEAAAACLGALASGDPDSRLRWSAIAALLSLGGVEYEAIQLTVGQAIVEACTGRAPLAYSASPLSQESESSESASDAAATAGVQEEDVLEWLLTEAEAAGTGEGEQAVSGEETPRSAPAAQLASAGKQTDALLKRVLVHLLTVTLESRHASDRTACAVWLVSVLHAASSSDAGKPSPAVVEALRDIQAALTRLLAEKSQFTQECAAKGLALLYDLSDDDSQEGLVSALVGTLSTGKRSEVAGASVSATVGAAGPAGTALSASGDNTYAEMCAFATDVGAPELIYRFLSMASSHALWHTRGGAGFGLEALLQSRARERVAPFVETLIPRLYRYQYDPSGRLRESMGRLWHALVRDPQVAVTKHLRGILTELLDAMASPKRRERQGAYMGLADALLGRQFTEVGGHMERMWEVILHGLDDVNEEVRKAAIGALRVLGRLTVRFCDPRETSGSDCAATLAAVVPFLAQRGVPSGVAEVRALCVYYLGEVCRVGVAHLAPHAPAVAQTALEAMASTESSSLAYLQLHADAGTGMHDGALGDMSGAELEKRRVAAAGSGTLGDIVTRCVNAVTGSQLPDLCERLRVLIKSGVGVPTRGGAARMVVALAGQARLAPDLKAESSALLKTLGACVEGASAGMQRELASAAAAIAKVAKAGSVRKYVERLLAMQATAESGAGRAAAGHAMLQLVRRAPDRVKRNAATVVPAAFLGSRDVDADAAAVWSDVWDGISASTAHTVRLYLGEVVAACAERLEASSWEAKRQGADAVVVMAGAAGQALAPHAAALLSKALRATPGRAWDGKEALLRAIAAIATKCPSAIDAPEGEVKVDEAGGATAAAAVVGEGPDARVRLSAVVRTLLLEAQKRSAGAAYTAAALDALGDVVTAFPAANAAPLLLPHLAPLMAKQPATVVAAAGAADGGKAGGDDGGVSKEMQRAAYRCLAAAWPPACPNAATKPGHGRVVAAGGAGAGPAPEPSPSAQATQAEHLDAVVTALLGSLGGSLWQERVAALEAVAVIVGKAAPPPVTSALTPALAARVVETATEQATTEIRYPSVRLAGVRVLAAVVRLGGPRSAVAKPLADSIGKTATMLERDADTRVASQAVLLNALINASP